MLTMSHRDAVTVLGGPVLAANRAKGFEQVAAMTGLSFSMIKRLFHGEAADPPASVERALELALAQGGLIAKGTRHELAELAGRLERAERNIEHLLALVEMGARHVPALAGAPPRHEREPVVSHRPGLLPRR